MTTLPPHEQPIKYPPVYSTTNESRAATKPSSNFSELSVNNSQHVSKPVTQAETSHPPTLVVKLSKRVHPLDKHKLIVRKIIQEILHTKITPSTSTTTLPNTRRFF
jgi:hypothetical protein